MKNMLGDIGFSSIAVVMPELYLAATSFLLLMYGVYRLKRCNNFMVLMGLLVLGFTACIVASGAGNHAVEMNGMFASDLFTATAKMLILLASAMVLLLAGGWLLEEGGRPFEFIILLLLATLGMMLMVSASDLLTLYMGLEMSSLSLYVLASFNRDHAKSSEAGLKYFVLGALASGMMLFGMSLVYGFAGSTAFEPLTRIFIAADGVASPGVIVGMILIIIGFCFKLSAAPFHMWTPDVYEGAPTPVTAFFATAPKVAALVLFTRVMLQPFGALAEQWQQVIVVVSASSMLLGALAAIMQTNIKRLLAYSSIGHAGFMLMGLAAANMVGVRAMLVYLALYIFMSVGAFACVLLMKRDGRAVEEIKDLSGLGQTRPALALAMGVFMFSMAGIPPLAGFFGKLYVLLAAIESGLVILAIIGVIASVIGCYYYLKVVKVMYFDEPSASFDTAMPFFLRTALVISVAVTGGFFLVPSWLIAHARAAAEALLQ